MNEENKRTSFEEMIIEAARKEIENGSVEKMIGDKVHKCIDEAIDDSFRWGDLKHAVEARIKEVLVPQIEGYDLSKYNVKLQQVLSGIIQETEAADTRKILENFRGLMKEEQRKTVTLEEIFKEHKIFVAETIECDGRGVIEGDGAPVYASTEATAVIEDEDDNYWSCFEHKLIQLSTDEDEQAEQLFKTIPIRRWKSSKDPSFEICYEMDPAFSDLRTMSDFDVFMCRLTRDRVKLEYTSEELTDDVEPEAQPEASFS